ncbi:MAG TPA: DUF4389 domain-containing protein [Chloroflexota bacterium]|nr:DUF4389 domain-containing protein [Chloroflexota bacterium]
MAVDTTLGMDEIYPALRAERPEQPNQLWAIPILGLIVKEILLIPQFIELVVLEIVVGILVLINSFVVLFTGAYWQPAYNLLLGFSRFLLKIEFFFAGLTDKYPGFDLSIDDRFSLDIASPVQPNRFFAIPIVGGIVRVFITIPFAIYYDVIATAAGIGMVISFVPVLFTGRYPEATFELIRDSARLAAAYLFYMAGVSDRYPNFSISMNHATTKIILIVIAVIAVLMNFATNLGGGGGRAR